MQRFTFSVNVAELEGEPEAKSESEPSAWQQYVHAEDVEDEWRSALHEAEVAEEEAAAGAEEETDGRKEEAQASYDVSL